MDSSNYLRNIVKEIIRELNKINVANSPQFVTYYVNLLILNPSWQIQVDSFTDREHIHNLIQYVVKKLRQVNSPEITTLRIQEAFLDYFEHRDDIIKYYRFSLNEKLLPLKHNILQIDQLPNKIKIENFYKKITCYCTLASGLGNPTLPEVFNEAVAALHSILFQSELNEFISKPKKLKEEQLEEFVDLVGGIRLFNRDCGKGGEGIESLPDIIKFSIGAMLQYAQKYLITAMERVNALTTALDNFLEAQIDVEIDDTDIEFITNLLVVFRQYELLIRKFITEVESELQTVDTISINLDAKLKQLHETVYMRIAIPAAVVFPLFIDIFECWRKLQNEVVAMMHLNEIFTYVKVEVSSLPYPQDLIANLIGTEGPLTDANRLSVVPENCLKTDNFEITIIKATNVENYQFQFLGFCSGKLLKSNGGLIPGNPNLGIVQYNNENYVFSSTVAAEEFLEDPKKHINKVLHLLRNKPQLINFLQVKPQLYKVRNILNLTEKVKDTSSVHDNGIQTEIHPIPRRIVPEYKWNIWDLKREALKLADLSKCLTVSTQTYKIFNRCPVHTQTCDLKAKEIQTKTDNYSNVPKPSHFIYGLRGRKDDKQCVFDLTRPVDE